MTRPANGSDVVLSAEAWTAVLRDGRRVSITVNHHTMRDTGAPWCYAWAQWPGIESRLHLSGNTAERAANRLVAAAINSGCDEDSVGVRELIPPDDVTREEAIAKAFTDGVASERKRARKEAGK